MVKVVAEKEGVAVDGVFEDDAEGDAVGVVFVRGMLEVGVARGGVFGVACFIFLAWLVLVLCFEGRGSYHCSFVCARRGPRALGRFQCAGAYPG